MLHRLIRSGKPSPPPAQWDLRVLPQGFIRADDLERPNWPVILDWFDRTIAAADRHEAWVQVQRQWLIRLGDSIGRCKLEESPRCLVLHGLWREDGQRIAQCAERMIDLISGYLPGIVQREVIGKLPIVAIHRKAIWKKWTGLGFEEAAGVCFRGGEVHVAVLIQPDREWEDVVMHETTHALLCMRRMPLWLEEGVAQRMERILDQQNRRLWEDVLPPLDLSQQDPQTLVHADLWRTRGLDRFWSGESFGGGDQVVRSSYWLAERLVNQICLCPGRLNDFLREAEERDAGEAAAQRHLGQSLCDFVSAVLGPGSWLSLPDVGERDCSHDWQAQVYSKLP